MELSVSVASLKRQRLFIGVVRDIGERKKADERQRLLTEELKQSELNARHQHALFQGVFDSAPEAILVCGLDYRALMINPAFRRLFGYQDEEFAGLAQMRIFSEESEWERIRTAQFGAGESAEMEPAPAYFRRKNGETFPGEITTSVYRDQNGAPQGHVSVIRDLSLEHQREEAQQRSQKLEVVGQLTGGVAHDFNNLLTVIIGNLELLEMRLEEEPLKVMLGKALDAADMGQRLTDSLLTFARRQTLSRWHATAIT
jgi:two-component system CheB/CheR fusion protein